MWDICNGLDGFLEALVAHFVEQYQLPDELDSTFALCRDFSDAISGVYFSLPGAPSARSVIDPACGEEMFEELKGIAGLQKRLILLYNANCYGAHATSADFRARILADLDFAQRELGVSDVTTASPFVAGVIKDAYPHVQVCASVNMRIGSIPAMQLLTDFDAFYLQRELLYDFERIAILKRWCDAHGKTLRLIANSGCLFDCPFHTYHDNLVAHEGEMALPDDADRRFPSPCWEAMYARSDVEAAALFLQGNWIRPEDIHAWEPYFSEAKLATRMHALPRRVVAAYARGSFRGNLTDLTEPAFSLRLRDAVLDSARIPDDFLAHKARCRHRCDTCGYCREVARVALCKEAGWTLT